VLGCSELDSIDNVHDQSGNKYSISGALKSVEFDEIDCAC